MRKYLRALAALGPSKKLLSLVGATKLGARALNRIARPRAIYSNAADAWAAAADHKLAGHDHPDAINMHLRLAEKLRPSDYAAMFWLSLLDHQAHIFDFGGNIGNLFYLYRKYLPADNGMRWTVFDIPAILERGRAIALERQAKGIAFTGDLTQAAGCDVFLASGSLHYWEGSITDLLEKINIRPAHILVNRSPMREHGPPFMTVQVTDHYSVPCLVRNINDVISEFGRHGYELIDRWSALELSIDLPLQPEFSIPAYSGLYFRLRP